MSSHDAEIVAEFVVESREHLADVENQLLTIESGGPQVDMDLVNEVFRAVHSIKGAAGFLGFSTLGKLAHEMENVLNLVRDGKLTPDSAVTDELLRSADTLKGMIENIDHSNDVDIDGHLDALQRVVAQLLAEESGQPAEAAAAPAPLPAEPASSTEPPPESESIATVQPAATAPPPATVKRESAPVAPTEAGKGVAGGSTTSSTAAETNIRVAVSVLDNLMNLAGELVLSRNQLLQAVNTNNHANLDSVAARLDQVTSELQETIMQARMQVVGTVFNKFPRIVRDLSSKLGKKCDLKLEGTEVELDKSIIEAIGDPLTHLIRNAIDHGVEQPQARREAGKPENGTILLRAFHQAGKVNISISDDGRGIDAARLKEKAVAAGVITSEQARQMSEREAVRLIFRPAFSMAEQVTDVSGRGVGMDVVKTNIEKLGGAVGVETEIGVGTTLSIKLPLTLAIIPSLIVRSAGRRFAIPQASIAELVRVKPTDVAEKIQRVKGAEVFRLRGHLIPLIQLNDALNAAGQSTAEDKDRTDESRNDGAMNIIVVETGHLRYGLVVDGLHDSEEIVVKPLGRHMQDCPCMAAATVLGDGTVAMILDVTGIASHSRLSLPDDLDLTSDEGAGEGLHDETQTVLLLSNDPEERFGIPMELVDRVERIRSEQIDSVGGQRVLQYRGQSLPLLCLEDHIQAQPRPERSQVYVAVFRAADREVGLIIPNLIDIRQLSINVDTLTFREAGVIGSLVVDDHAVRLLDLYELCEAARPDWFVDRPQVQRDDDSRPTILLAEDSNFFRKQLVGYLESEGYDVVACEDGAVAWETLDIAEQPFDMLVTDLEMPNMDGFQLSRKVRDDGRFGAMPILAVTSLAGEEDMQRGREAGIDEYHVKLDRERLTVSIAARLRSVQAR